jgi:acyl-CoA ligase (AMP-forming) (exosortase A-associated)
MNTRAPMLLHQLAFDSAERAPHAIALTCRGESLDYTALAGAAQAFAGGLATLGMARGARVAVYLEQRFEFVIAALGISAAGGALVPVNPVLKAAQVGHILNDCGVDILVTSAERLAQLALPAQVHAGLRHLVLVGTAQAQMQSGPPGCAVHGWSDLLCAAPGAMHRVIDADLAMIFYTSGSTGKPKGVMVSHRNLVTGAQSVAGYLGNRPDDVILAALPLSFDAGFSQLTTAFWAGARAVLLNYLLPRDLLAAMRDEGVTGLTAVPPLYSQLARLDWPAEIAQSLRYFASTGGKMPRATLAALRAQVPGARPYLMYGLTEAFRSTYLPPEEVDRRPDSIGRAIPGAEVLVLRTDGSPCEPDEPGELVHRGALVSLGYWNDAAKTRERFRPLPAAALGGRQGHMLDEIAVFSGDTVKADAEGFLYFVGRSDDMIKTSGYRVSPTEIEELVLATGKVAECVAFGVADEALGQTVCLIVTPAAGEMPDTAALLAICRANMPRYMLPANVRWENGPLPRNSNGKFDRPALRERFQDQRSAGDNR